MYDGTGSIATGEKLEVPQPVGHFVFVKMPRIADKIGSILLPTQTKETQERASIKGELLGVGPACKNLSPGQVGKTVWFGRYAGVIIEEGDDLFRLIDEDEIRAIS